MKADPESVRIRRRRLPGIGFAAFLLALAASYSGSFFQSLELSIYDLWLNLRPAETHESRVSVITVTDRDLTRLGNCAVPDGVLAGALSALLAHHPRAIGVDLYRDIPIAPGTEELERTLNSPGPIVIARKFADAAYAGVEAPDYLRNPERAACNDLSPDPDNRVRRALLYLGDDESLCYTLAYRLALLYLEHRGVGPRGEPGRPDILRLGRALLPPLESHDGGYLRADAGGYQILLDFRNRPASFREHTLADLLSGRVPAGDIEGKIVLIGTEAEGSDDFFSLPLNGADRLSERAAGVKVHGLLADQLVRAALDGETPIGTVPEWAEILGILLWCLAGSAVGTRYRGLGGFLTIQVLGLGAAGAGGYGLFLAGLWIPVIPSSLGWLASTSLTAAWTARHENRQRRLAMNLFGRHVDPRIADEIWRHRAQILTAGRIAPTRMVATVFFSDLVGFTTVAERLEPGIFFTWLNEYLNAMTEVIHRHGGVTLRFVGDAILAGFGIPVPRVSEDEISQDAGNAARCAVAIQERLIILNKCWQEKGLPAAGMRIGINTGPILAGSLGSGDRLEYTLHGDVVNIAARLESFDKDCFEPDQFAAPCRILLGAATADLLAHGFRLASLGRVELRGKREKPEIFRLIGEE